MLDSAKRLFTVGIAVFALTGIQAQAITPTPQMLEQFKKLPRSQQEQLAKQYGVDLNSIMGGQRGNTRLENPVIVNPRRTERSAHRATKYASNSMDEQQCVDYETYKKLKKRYKANGYKRMPSVQQYQETSMHRNRSRSNHEQGDQSNDLAFNRQAKSRHSRVKQSDNLNINGFNSNDYEFNSSRDELTDAIFCKSNKKGSYRINENGELVFDDASKKKAKQELKLFGYDMFAGSPTTFAPVSDAPVPVEYMVGPGDTINVQLFGKESNEYSLTVQRNGTVQFPELGPISLVGMNFEQARNFLNQKIKKSMIGIEANISMGELRSIRIFIAGDAYQPGSYTVSSLATITQALFVSGGINEIGSLRNIQLKRAGKVVGTLDLYDLLLDGDASGDLRLQSGDVVFIPANTGRVSVSGEVRRPAIYELKKGESFAQAIKMAGGLKPSAYAKDITVERFSQDHLKNVVSFDMTNLKSRKSKVKNGDFIRVNSVSERIDNAIDVAGAVTRAGQYQWRKGIRVSDILSSIRGDLTEAADQDYSLILREINTHGDVEVIQFSIGKAISKSNSEDNLILQPRDKVLIFDYADRSALLEPVIIKLQRQTRLGTAARLVEINGNVRFPGIYPVTNKNRVKQLLIAAGGMEEGSYTLSAELTRQLIVEDTGVRVIHRQLNLADVMNNEPSQNIELNSRDVLTVRTLPDWHETRWITVKGEVRFPGTYSIQRGETMKDVLERAGGFTDDAFPFGAIFLRESIKEKEKQQVQNLVDELRREIAAKALTKDGGSIAFSEAQLMLTQLEKVQVVGRLAIDLKAIVNGDNQADITLEGDDELYIPARNQTVSVMGQVQYPSTHRYVADESFDDYLTVAGGPRKRADEGRAYILRANGSVIFPEHNWLSDGTRMKAGDTIIVPLDTEYKDRLTLWQQVTSIIYNSAVALSAISKI